MNIQYYMDEYGGYGGEFYEDYDDLGEDDFEKMAQLEKEMENEGVHNMSSAYVRGGSNKNASGAHVPAGAMPSQGKSADTFSHFNRQLPQKDFAVIYSFHFLSLKHQFTRWKTFHTCCRVLVS